jgi:hypothetical protein
MKPNIITLLLITLTIAAGAYWYFFTGTGNETPLTSTAAGDGAQAQFQTLVSELQPITFDTKIFTDPRFLSLVDLATPITPEQSGRPDPFAPIPGVSGK